ncbi:hypothetical protein F4805DRAFT_141364 [Annulohypoxylon moriforme]|nr:hypothetical protein F4805DRAFT_141364 [Annulohypoxylon moriforme]
MKFSVPFVCQLLVSLTQGLTIQERQVQPNTWRIQDLNRQILWQTNQVVTTMLIVDGSPTSVWCEVYATAPPNTDLPTWSFSDYNCLNNDWSIYWGYQPGNDAAVMTVVSPQKDKRAFFGFDHVSTQTHLGNAGPSQVETV